MLWSPFLLLDYCGQIMIRENCFKKKINSLNQWMLQLCSSGCSLCWEHFQYFSGFHIHAKCVRASLGSLMEMLLFYSLLPMYWNLPWKLGWVLYFTVVTWILELSREQVIYLFNCSRTLNIVIILILPLGTQFSQFLDEAEEEGKYNVGERICWFCVYVYTSLLFLFTYMNFLSSWLFLFKFLGS